MADPARPMKLELLTIGKELLIGKTVNTNATWLGRRVAKMGSMIQRITTVTDSVPEISEVIRESLARKPNFLITVGGLGPTPDDLTLKGLDNAVNKKLTLNKVALQQIKKRYMQSGVRDFEITPARRKMATLPETSTPLENTAGTAPGVRLVSNSTVIFSLPGVPREMRAIFRRHIEPEILKKLGRLYPVTVVMMLRGIFESVLAPILQELGKKYPMAYIKSHPKGVKEGVSLIELDVGVVSNRKTEAIGLAKKIAVELRRAIESSGGHVSALESV
jgi:molybdenum cofactor synthesis domain-containing protein